MNHTSALPPIARATTLLLFCFFAAHAQWSKEFTIVDYMDIYSFPEQLVSYAVDFPASTVHRQHLKLVHSGAPIPFQLADVTESDGFLSKARVSFRASLLRSGRETFVLSDDPGYTSTFPDNVAISDTDPVSHTAILRTGRISLRVPWGEIAHQTELSAVPAPIVALSRTGTAWVGQGKFVGDADILSMNTQVVNDGCLSIVYRINYTMTGNRRYSVDLTIQDRESYVSLDENIEGITGGDSLFFVFSYQNGVDPDARIAQGMLDNGYSRMSGDYALGAGADGKLPISIGLWATHNDRVPFATAFYNNAGSPDNAIIFSSNRPREWKSASDYWWYVPDAPEQLHFFSTANDKFMRAQLIGKERHWALALIARDSLVIKGLSWNQINSKAVAPTPGVYKVYKDWADHGMGAYPVKTDNEFGAGPEIRLHQRLTYLNLDTYKDMAIDFSESMVRYPDTGLSVTWDTYWNNEQGTSWWLRRSALMVAERGLHSNARAQFRNSIKYFPDYANSRQSWTESQRKHIRSVLIWIANLEADDVQYPHTSMIGGHANFIADAKDGIAYAAAIFPSHPHASRWADEYSAFFTKWVNTYTYGKRSDILKTEGGRWHENTGNYASYSLQRINWGLRGISLYGGATRISPLMSLGKVKELLRWWTHILIPAEGTVSIPEQGDYGGGAFPTAPWKVREVEKFARFMNDADTMLANNALRRVGKLAGLPRLESTLFSSYGALLHYQKGDDEAYCNIQQLSGSGYRWGANSQDNGLIFYSAKDKNWSWYDANQTGTNYRAGLVSCPGDGLGDHVVDGVLYNFGDAQFYRAMGVNNTKFRATLMVRDEYLALYDVNCGGSWHWANHGDSLPTIVDISGRHVVAPRSVPIAGVSKPYGGRVNGDYVFLLKDTATFTEDSMMFSGKTAWAGEDELALFEGSKLQVNGFGISRNGGDFGLNAVYIDSTAIRGRFAGRSGGIAGVTVPPGFGLTGKKVWINGKEVPCSTNGNTVQFSVNIAQSDGYKVYEILAPGRLPTTAFGNHPENRSIGKRILDVKTTRAGSMLVVNSPDMRNACVRIHTLNGRIIRNLAVSQGSLAFDLSGISPGHYIAELRNREALVLMPFVVTR